MNFYASHIQLFTSDSNSKHNNSQGFENSRIVLRGCVWVGESFLKPWQVTDNIIEWIFMQFTFNILWVTLTQNIITRRVFKNSWMVLRGCVSVRESFLSHDKWQIILLSEFLYKSHSTFYKWLIQKIITCRVSKIHEWVLRGCVWVGAKFLNAMTSDR